MTIAERLDISRVAAARAATAEAAGKSAQADTLWQSALDERLAAHNADRRHSDPAWLRDLMSAKGEIHRDPRTPLAERLQIAHANFVRYFQQQLGEIETIQTPLTLDDVKARIQIPPTKDGDPAIPIEETEAFVTLALEHGLGAELTEATPTEMIAAVKERLAQRPAPSRRKRAR